MSPQSHFNAHTLLEIFRDLYLSERTGRLTLRRENEEKQIYFGRGLIHFAESSEEQEQVGPVLVAEGRISAGALAEASHDAGDTEQLVQALLNRGLIAKQVLRRSLRALVDRIVRSVFAWDGGTADFVELDDVPELFEVDVLSTFAQILRGIEAVGDFDPIREAMLGLDNALKLHKPAPVPLDRLTLTRAQGYVLSRIDGRTNFRDVISTLPEGKEDPATRFVFGLLVMAVADYDPPLAEGPFRVANILRDHADRVALERMQEKTVRLAYERMRTQNPHEVLGVTPHASRRAIERAYAEAKSLFQRDRLLPRVRDGFRDELGVIESRLVESYLQLTQAERPERGDTTSDSSSDGQRVDVQDLLVRPELDKTRTRAAEDEAGRVAELYFAKARKAMRAGDFHNAIQYGKLAVSYKDDDARFYFMLADCQVRNPEARWQRMAEENYTRATQLDPWNADYWISLGRFYAKRGLHLRARRQFEEALKLVPEHAEATKEMQKLR